MNINPTILNQAFPEDLEKANKAFTAWQDSLPDKPMQLVLQFGVCDIVPYAYRYRLWDKQAVGLRVEILDMAKTRVLDFKDYEYAPPIPDGMDIPDFWLIGAQTVLAHRATVINVADMQSTLMKKYFEVTHFDADKFMAEVLPILSDQDTWHYLTCECLISEMLQEAARRIDDGDPTEVPTLLAMCTHLVELQDEIWVGDK
jgi:hypothetical protein